MSINTKYIGSDVTEEDLNALNYLVLKHIELTDDITLIKKGYEGKYGLYSLDSSVNDNYTGNCILNYNMSLNDIRVFLIVEYSNSENEKITIEEMGDDGVITITAPTGYDLFSPNAIIKIKNGNMG